MKPVDYEVDDLVVSHEFSRPKWWQFWRRPEPISVTYRCVATGRVVMRMEKE